MNPYRMAKPPGRWSPQLSPWLTQLTAFFRRRKARQECQLTTIDIQRAEIVRQAVADGQGVLITPNHPTHADAYTLYAAADACGFPFYCMATWHVFDTQRRIGQWLLQKHGVFSVDREGTDVEALKTARDILQNRKHPLVIFPEGEVYHTNDRVTPFREGAAAIALFAARKAKRPLVCIPAALKYRYRQDPMNELLEVMDRLEQSIHWRPRPEQDISQRIYELGSALMSLKELEFLGGVQVGSLPERTAKLADFILCRHEKELGLSAGLSTVPERVKAVRGVTLNTLEEVTNDAASTKLLDDRLDDMFLVVQLFSYPGDYVAEKPSIERVAETIDKLEEDVLHQYSATVRSERSVCMRFGDAIEVSSEKKKNAVHDLTDRLHQSVQVMIDDLQT